MMIFLGMGVATPSALLVERIAYRPLRNAPRLVPLITAIGASFFLQNTFRVFFGPQTRGYPELNSLKGRWEIIPGVPILRTQTLVIIFAIVAVVGLTL